MTAASHPPRVRFMGQLPATRRFGVWVRTSDHLSIGQPVELVDDNEVTAIGKVTRMEFKRARDNPRRRIRVRVGG